MSKIIQMVRFRVDRECFGITIEKVKEIVKVPDITPVPDTPDFMEGVINLRGRIVPVIDMRKRIGAPPAERGKSNRALILEVEGGRQIGLIVDSASEILKLSEDAIEKPPDMVASAGADYVTAVGKCEDGLIVMLDLARLLSVDDMHAAADAAGGETGEGGRDAAG